MQPAEPSRAARVGAPMQQGHSTRQEELEIALQVAHEVNSHLNREVEQLTLRVESLTAEREACLAHIRFLATKLAEERRLAAGSAAMDESEPVPEELLQPGAAAAAEAASQLPTGADGSDMEWLHDKEWQRVKSMGQQRGWLIDPQEVILGEVLGQGSFGTVHRGTWRGGVAAVKCIRVTSRSEAISFLREVEALSLVRHANVMPMYGACIDPPGQCWLVCEYLPGGTLATWLYGPPGSRRPPERSLTERLRMALDVARGMQALEESSPPIMHRDLKPSNVFIDAAGAARVADMGLARVLTPAAMVSLTGETGTYVYMSPECIRHELYDTRSDVWSWGVMCVELLAQQKPYAHLYATPVQIALQVAEGQLHPAIPPSCPPALAQLLEACFEPDPMARPSFGLIVAQLTRIQADAARRESERAADNSWGKWLGAVKGRAAAAAQELRRPGSSGSAQRLAGT